MDELNELQKYINEGKKNVHRILSWIHYNKIEIPVKLDLDYALDMFKFMDGYVACLKDKEKISAQTESEPNSR